MSSGSWEVELKFHVDDTQQLEKQLDQIGFLLLEIQHHEDCYYRHPCRNFIQTDEAFRIRCVNDQAMVTYKGPRNRGPVKTREEIELRISTEELSLWKLMVEKLGFVPVSPVRKIRRLFSANESAQYADIHVTIDSVEQLGEFAEIEIVVNQKEELSNAENRVTQLAGTLGLNRHQPRSYLSLLQEKLRS